MQQNKNLIIAIVLCLGIMFGWGYLAEFMGWVKRPDPVVATAQQEVAQDQARIKAEQEKREAEAKAKAVVLPVFTPAEGRDVKIDTPLYQAVVYSGGGILRSYLLTGYGHGLEASSPRINLVNPPTAAVAPWGLLVNGQPSWSTGKWAFEGDDLKLGVGTQGTLRFVGEVDGMRIVREFLFRADTYLMTEKIRITPLGDQPRSVRLGFTVASDGTAASGGQYDAMRVAWDLAGKFKEDSDTKDLSTTGVQDKGQIFWASTMSTYFMNAVAPADTADLTLKGRLQNDIFRAALERPDLVIPAGTETEVDVSYWVGPKVRSLLAQAPNNLVNTIDLGMFSIIAKALLWLLQYFYDYVHNWGVAIILLTVLIKAAFWPLTAKSYASMEKMKKLQPMMTSLREKYADNKEQMNKEVMSLYKTYGVNPASGCVPILVQLPVFFGLYQALLTSIELRHASLITYLPGTDMLWLADLSAKDPYYITPIIMGITMFLQQRMSPPAGDPMQQKIMMFLPLIFTAMFLNFPSGLVIYWLVNNVLSIAQQWMMMRKLKAA
ncbi:MAG: membrane protein insertase YidC [Desulfovibrionaceae bacterium]